ncbi:MAG: pyridoxal-phosphate dependent enzyme [Planctomycetes bacterium]|nr:pyridoxal-phosphate dependent enzyme [Planctomycetota bacterium]
MGTLHSITRAPGAWRAFEAIHIAEAAERVRGVVRRTRLEPIESGDERVELRAKLENRQETGAFKARGAWNQIAQLGEEQRRAGVVCASSGNHGKALAWAAARAGVRATIVMPANAYPNKVQACRDEGAQVVLMPTREEADLEVERRVREGSVLVHPYDAARTLEGAGTVGLEIAQDWPEVDAVVIPVGGGGLLAGSALALRRELGERVRIYGAEPEGAATLTRGLERGAPVVLGSITSKVQGLTPLYSGQINIDIARATLDGVFALPDETILAAQKRLVAAGETVEPAGAAACAVVFARLLPLASGSTRVAAVVSGGNADPAQLAALRAELARDGARS